MYDHVRGEVVERQPARVVLSAAGVGYELKVPVSTSERLVPGAEAILYTILHVVDGVPSLLGFGDRAERELARQLLGVAGVGPAVCLAILSAFSAAAAARVIAGGDSAALQRIKGIGKKTAERLCLELRDRVADRFVDGTPDLGSPAVLVPAAAADAIAALVTLGYNEKDARERVTRCASDAPNATTEALIRRVLSG